MNKHNATIRHRLILKGILNLWTIVTITMFMVDFISGNGYDTSVSAIGVIYLIILGIYVSDKEYSRWQNNFASRFLGEGFVIVWTVMMVLFVVLAPLSDGRFRIPAEFAFIYTSVIGTFAITMHSKALKERKK
ncbi:MAG: hypothetical protein HUU49_01190 [Candidatus Buchananbacteria bacterium]|nr:hypothetical protein [Candidatus Buchananbacteria bacterium]